MRRSVRANLSRACECDASNVNQRAHLSQIRFRKHSETKLDGKVFSMEAHLLHRHPKRTLHEFLLRHRTPPSLSASLFDRKSLHFDAHRLSPGGVDALAVLFETGSTDNSFLSALSWGDAALKQVLIRCTSIESSAHITFDQALECQRMTVSGWRIQVAQQR